MRSVPRLGLVAGLWSAWVLLHLIRTGGEDTFAPLQRWVLAGALWQQADFRGLTASGLFIAAARHLSAFLVAAAAAIACLGIGREPVRWVGSGVTGETGAIRVLAGFGLAGAWMLGLALAGLWFPAVLLALPVAALGAGTLRLILRGRTRGGPGSTAWWRGMPAPGLVALAAGIPAILLALVPDVSGDPDKGHLAAAGQWLIAHRLDGFAPAVALHYPMTVEMNDVVALLLGRTEVAHLIHLVPFLAAVGLAARWAAAHGGPAAGWLAGAGILTLGTAGEQFGTAKSDLGAAAFTVSGALLAVRWAQGGPVRLLVLSGACFGFGAASKFNGMAVAAVGLPAIMLLRRGGRRPGWLVFAWVAAGTAAVVPWLAKNWLLVGDPVWPVASRWLPGAIWDAHDQAAMALLLGRAEMTPARWAGLASLFPRGLAEAQPAAALAIPVVAVSLAMARPPVRWLAGFGLAAFAAVAVSATFEAFRLALPAWMLWITGTSVVVARAANHWRPARVRAACRLAAVLAWAPVGGVILGGPEPGLAVAWLTGTVTRDGFHAAALTTYDDARRAVAALPGARRIILIGDGRLGRYPCRVSTDRFPGRTFGWQAAGACATAGRIAVKMRQAGCRWIVYNPVWESFPHPVQTAWIWDDRRLQVWREFVGRHLVVSRWPVRPDDPNGGFAFLELRVRPLPAVPATMPYLPGLQSLTFPMMQTGLTGRAPEGAELGLALVRRVPGVHALAETVGKYCELQERWADVERVLRPGVLDRYPGRRNFTMWARAMDRLGRRREAVRLLEGMMADLDAWPVIREALKELSIAPRGEYRDFGRVY